MPVVAAGQVLTLVTAADSTGQFARVAVRTVARGTAATIRSKARMGESRGDAMAPIPRGEMVLVVGLPPEGTILIDNSHGDTPVEATVISVSG